MTTTTFSWLHLTDLHFGLTGQASRWPNVRKSFFDDLADLYTRCGPWDAVFFTGDLVQQGTSAEFAAMQEEVLDQLWEKLAELGSGKAVLLAVPGNHDLQRPNQKIDNPAVDALLDVERFPKIADKFWSQATGSYRQVIDTAFAPYSAWWNSTPQRAANITTGALPGDFVCSLAAGEKQIGVMGLNTAFLQLDKGDYHGKLVWDVQQVHALCAGGVDKWLAKHEFCILLSHQGPDWLTPAAREQGKIEITPPGRFAVHLFGHMHENKLEYTQLGGSSKAARLLQSCSLFGMEYFGEPPTQQRNHGYCAGQIRFNLDETTLRIWPRSTTSKGGWRFIPDHQLEGKLEDDQGTEPIVIAQNKAKAKLHAVQSAPVAPPAVTTSPSCHSTLPNRRVFYGREAELADIARYLRAEQRGWGVALDGPGGMGKTALAIEAAYRAPVTEFPTKLFVTAKHVRMEMDGRHQLHDQRVDNYHELMAQIAVALIGPPAHKKAEHELADVVRHALASRPSLLVLDNLEHFNLAERRRIFDLLDTLPEKCRAIITSRRRDDTAARFIRLDQLAFADAQKLLADLCLRLPNTVQLSLQDQEQLHRETGGNPLLMIWLASQLGRVQGRSANLAQALERMHDAQKHNPNNDPLEFVFGDLVESFNPAELAMLAALSHFSQPADISWLLPLCNILRPEAESALEALQARSIVVRSDEGWLLPPLCGKFLRTRRADLVNQTGDKLAEQAYAWAMQHGGGSANAPFDAMEKLWTQIEAAIPCLLRGESTRLQQFCDEVHRFLDFSGRWQLALTLHASAENRALAEGDVINAGWRAHHQAWLYFLQGNGTTILQTAERTLRHWQKTGDNERAAALQMLGLAYNSLGKYSAAIVAIEAALRILNANQADSAVLSMALNSLASTKQAAGNLAGAERDFHKALALAQKRNFREGIAIYTGNLAEVAFSRRNWQQAEKLARQALVISSSLGRQELIAAHNQELARALLAQRRTKVALPHAKVAMNIFSRLASPYLAEAQATLAACEAAIAAGE